MADRYDLKVARQGRDGKTYWTKVGVMFPMRERDGFNITLEALPLQTMNDQGQLECRITAWEPYKDDVSSGYDAGGSPPTPAPPQAPTSDPDGEPPF
jgi:hypothetical protein